MPDHSNMFTDGGAVGCEEEFSALSVDLISGDSVVNGSIPAAPKATNNNAANDQSSPPLTIYQLNFDVEHIGKKKPQSKRQATWTYGFPTQQYTVSATTGGEEIILEEHQARLTWSTHSGKYSIEVDGHVVFENVAKGSVLEQKFIYNHTKGCINSVVALLDNDDDNDSSKNNGGENGDVIVPLRIVACRKPPVRSSKNFRCYEFVIGGRVFRDLPRGRRNDNQYGEEFHNEDSTEDVGFLSSILDIVDPSWRSVGMA
jgi:hypothetical protein